MAFVGRIQLIQRALNGFAIRLEQQSNIIEWAETFHRLEPKNHAVLTQCVGQQGLDIPGIGHDDVVRGKSANRMLETLKNRRQRPVRLVELQLLAPKAQVTLDLTDFPR